MKQYGPKEFPHIKKESGNKPGHSYIFLIDDEGKCWWFYDDGEKIDTREKSGMTGPPSNWIEIPEKDWVFKEHLGQFSIATVKKCDCDGFTLLHSGHKCGL